MAEFIPFDIQAKVPIDLEAPNLYTYGFNNSIIIVVEPTINSLDNTKVQARIDGGPWVTLGETSTGEAFSWMFLDVTQGQTYTIQARLSKLYFEPQITEKTIEASTVTGLADEISLDNYIKNIIDSQTFIFDNGRTVVQQFNTYLTSPPAPEAGDETVLGELEQIATLAYPRSLIKHFKLDDEFFYIAGAGLSGLGQSAGNATIRKFHKGNYALAAESPQLGSNIAKLQFDPYDSSVLWASGDSFDTLFKINRTDLNVIAQSSRQSRKIFEIYVASDHVFSTSLTQSESPNIISFDKNTLTARRGTIPTSPLPLGSSKNVSAIFATDSLPHHIFVSLQNNGQGDFFAPFNYSQALANNDGINLFLNNAYLDTSVIFRYVTSTAPSYVYKYVSTANTLGYAVPVNESPRVPTNAIQLFNNSHIGSQIRDHITTAFLNNIQAAGVDYTDEKYYYAYDSNSQRRGLYKFEYDNRDSITRLNVTSFPYLPFSESFQFDNEYLYTMTTGGELYRVKKRGDQ